MKTTTRPRGRPRSYDPDQALQRARDAFWRTGYAGTSLDDLAVAMQMNRPSVYAAFGNKQALYERTLTRYAANSCDALARTLAAPGALRENLSAVYRGACDFYCGAGARGCYLVGTALTEARTKRRVRSLLERTFQRFSELFEQRFERAARSGELGGAAHPNALAQIATATLNTLSLRARTGATRATLDGLASATIDVICGPRRDPTSMLELKKTAQGVSIQVRVAARASRTAIVGLHAGALKVSLAAPPVDGAANDALCELIADRLGVPRRAVTISHGLRSKTKTVHVRGAALAQVACALDPG